MTLKYWGFSSLEIETCVLADAIQEVKAIATLRPTHWRLMVPWEVVAKAADPSTWNWSDVDRIVDVISTNGIQPLLIIGQGVPSWVSTPDRATYYGQFCAAVATRYGTSGGLFGKICTAFEIWNEENANIFWGASVSPANYNASLMAAYTAIKAVSGLSGDNSTVVFGGLQPVPQPAGPWYGEYWETDSMIDFVTRCFTANPNIGNYFDVLALHPYTDANYGKSGTYEPTISQDCWQQVSQVIQFIQSQGLTPRIWLTEVGFSTKLMTQALQNSYMQEAWALAQTFPQIEMFLIYNARDSSASGSQNDTYGVMTYTFAQKTIWAWLETLAPTVIPPPVVVTPPIAPVPVVGAGVIQPPGMVPEPIAPVPSVPTAPPMVALDSEGAGVFATSGSGSEAHTLGTGADCLLAGLVVSQTGTFHADAYTTLEVMCGSTPMELVLSEDYGAFDSAPRGSVSMFALMNPPTGAQTISATVVPPSGSIASIQLNSLSYSGVGAIENVIGESLHNHTLQLTVMSETDGVPVIVAGFIGTPTAFNETVRYTHTGTDAEGVRTMILGDAPGNISVEFTTTDYSNHGAVALNLKKAA